MIFILQIFKKKHEVKLCATRKYLIYYIWRVEMM
jgi:hypothetical protein